MRKIILVIALFLSVNCKSISLDSLSANKIDTVLIIPHPNERDSADVVKIVNGVISFTTVFVKNPLAKELIKNPIVSGGIVAFILNIWRIISKRRLRRKGLLIDKKIKDSTK